MTTAKDILAAYSGALPKPRMTLKAFCEQAGANYGSIRVAKSRYKRKVNKTKGRRQVRRAHERIPKEA
jgi:hypothetical protein